MRNRAINLSYSNERGQESPFYTNKTISLKQRLAFDGPLHKQPKFNVAPISDRSRLKSMIDYQQLVTEKSCLERELEKLTIEKEYLYKVYIIAYISQLILQTDPAIEGKIKFLDVKYHNELKELKKINEEQKALIIELKRQNNLVQKQTISYSDTDQARNLYKMPEPTPEQQLNFDFQAPPLASQPDKAFFSNISRGSTINSQRGRSYGPNRRESLLWQKSDRETQTTPQKSYIINNQQHYSAVSGQYDKSHSDLQQKVVKKDTVIVELVNEVKKLDPNYDKRRISSYLQALDSDYKGREQTQTQSEIYANQLNTEQGLKQEESIQMEVGATITHQLTTRQTLEDQTQNYKKTLDINQTVLSINIQVFPVLVEIPHIVSPTYKWMENLQVSIITFSDRDIAERLSSLGEVFVIRTVLIFVDERGVCGLQGVYFTAQGEWFSAQRHISLPPQYLPPGFQKDKIQTEIKPVKSLRDSIKKFEKNKNLMLQKIIYYRSQLNQFIMTLKLQFRTKASDQTVTESYGLDIETLQDYQEFTIQVKPNSYLKGQYAPQEEADQPSDYMITSLDLELVK